MSKCDVRIVEAIMKEREEIYEMISNFRFPFETMSDEHTPLSNRIAKLVGYRTCKDIGHMRGIKTNQINGREKCGRCGSDIDYPESTYYEQTKQASTEENQFR